MPCKQDATQLLLPAYLIQCKVCAPFPDLASDGTTDLYACNDPYSAPVHKCEKHTSIAETTLFPLRPQCLVKPGLVEKSPSMSAKKCVRNRSGRQRVDVHGVLPASASHKAKPAMMQVLSHSIQNASITDSLHRCRRCS